MELEKEFTEEEVFDVIKHFEANKFPRPDGFSMEFYKSCWHIIKSDFMKVMGEFYCRGTWDWRSNCSFVSLIPKKEDSSTSKDFRPLSLLGSAYKVLSKVLANRLKLINPSKGLRQGDSLSPFLSVLVVEILSKVVLDAVVRGQIHGFQVKENGSIISHLQFADDTLLVKAESGKELLISVGADSVISSLALELGCKVEKLPIKYLGLPIGVTSRCASVWDEVIQRMEDKLATWKKKFLNKASRLVLIKSCLAIFHVYFLSLIHMLAEVEKKLTRLMRNFLWDASENRRKMCWVSWLKICRLKHLGDFGVKNLKITSKSFKEKWIWRYSRENKQLWRRVVQEKFCNNPDILLPSDNVKPKGRSVWKNILNSSYFLQESTTFKLNNENSVKFWLDEWSSLGKLRDKFTAICAVIKLPQLQR
ncbi:uncharacterized protein LOC113306253 [Papaver somniferum]|uniref:uncharacterized protein LOC113306253 n=1 Tax=Papaver somniferum TaxID=3469 RepID=UPI000E6F71AC|nr:uncharacterized protein LOC113306253 [Papaver somniferum]